MEKELDISKACFHLELCSRIEVVSREAYFVKITHDDCR